jgi:hypothetical protein
MTTLSIDGRRIIITDAIVILLAYLLPAISHLTPFPLFYLDPMRIFVVTGYLFSRNKYNGLLLAFTIPIFSMLVTGHPPFFKSLLISFELIFNLLLLFVLSERFKWNVTVAFFISVVLSKAIYYGLKYFFILGGLIEGQLVSTGFEFQLLTAIFVTIIFTFTGFSLNNRERRQRNR